MKTVITGATSFIGTYLVRSLLKNGDDVWAVVRPHSQKTRLLSQSPNIHLVQADMADYSALDKLLPEQFDNFIHLAWDGTRGSDRMNEPMQEENYRRSMEALSAVMRLRCHTVMLAGSQAEYGVHHAPIDEGTPCIPNTEYGKWKLKLYENAVSVCSQEGVRLLEPRFFSLYGPSDFEGTMVISILKKMLKNEDCPLTACRQMWDFLFITDAADGILKLLKTDCPGGVYNFGSGVTRPLKDFVEDMARLTGTKSKLLFGAVPYGPSGIVDIEPNVHKLAQATGWSPAVSFDDGITAVIEY